MFRYSQEIILLMQKLGWYCHPSNPFGPKRVLLNEEHPNLCPLYDEFIFSNSTARDYLGSLKPLGTTLTLANINDYLNLSQTQALEFRQELMKYAANNLIMINAYIESPYVTKYETDEVISFIRLSTHFVCR